MSASSAHRSTGDTLPPFSGLADDFPGWKMQAEAALDAKGLLGAIEVLIVNSGHGVVSVMVPDEESSVVDGEDEANEEAAAAAAEAAAAAAVPPDAALMQDAKKAFAMLLCSFKNPETLDLMSDVPRGNAFQLWKRLNAHFARTTAAGTQVLHAKFNGLRQGEGEGVAVYLARAKKLCMALRVVDFKVSTVTLVSTFVNGLRADFSQVRLLLPMMGNKDLDTVADIVLAAEATLVLDALRLGETSRRGGGDVAGQRGESAHFVSESSHRGGGGGGGGGFGGGIVCWRCNKVGHTKRECPTPGGGGGGRGGGGGMRSKCSYCQKDGHSADVCFSRKNGVPATPVGGGFVARAASAVSDFVFSARVSPVSLVRAGAAVSVVSAVSAATVCAASSVVRAGQGDEVMASTKWRAMVDSGASCDIVTSGVRLVGPVVSESVNISIANGAVLTSPSVGQLVVRTAGGAQLRLDKVLSHPQMSENLLSVGQRCPKGSGRSVVFDERGVTFYTREGGIIATGAKDESTGLYTVELECVDSVVAHAAVVSEAPAVVVVESDAAKQLQLMWHCRLCHLSIGSMAKLQSAKAVDGLEGVAVCASDELCSGCMVGKAHRESFGGKVSDRAAATRPLERVHSDLCGPFPPSYGGKLYLLLIIDEFTRKAWGTALKHKHEAAESIMNWCRAARAQQQTGVVEFHTDGGGEFVNNVLKRYFAAEGIAATTTQPHTPQHNGIAERKNRTVVEAIRASLLHAGAPKALWAECAMAVIYTQNRCIVRSGSANTPDGLWFHRAAGRPSVSGLRVLCCDAWIHVPDHARGDKLDPKAALVVFVGYDVTKQAYRLFDPRTRQIVCSRDVRFSEAAFTQCALLSEDDGDELDIDAITFNNETRLMKIVSIEHKQAEAKEADQAEAGAAPAPPAAAAAHVDIAPIDVSIGVRVPAVAAAPSEFDGAFDFNPDLRRGSRKRAPPSRLGMVDLKDVGASSAVVVSAVDRAAVETVCAMHVAATRAASDPETYEEAMAGASSKEWAAAMEGELSSLEAHKTWTVVELPAGAHTIGSKWVFRRKYDADGRVCKYKARLVAKGFAQREGEYGETFAPVLYYKTLRVLLALAATDNYELLQMDVPTAFLNATIKEEVFMRLPAGLAVSVRENMACRLNKTLYGVKQAPREWNEEFNAAIVALGYTRCASDTCVYVRQSVGGRAIILPVFVDDVFPLCHPSDLAELQVDLHSLMARYAIPTVGEASVVLGMRVRRDRPKGVLTLDQEVWVSKLLEQHNMRECNPCVTPEQEQRSDVTSPAAAAAAAAAVEAMQAAGETSGSGAGIDPSRLASVRV